MPSEASVWYSVTFRSENRSSALPPSGMLIAVGTRLREARDAVGGLRAHRAGIDRVRVAAAVEQEVLVLVVGERLRIEGHADEVEVRIEAVHLDRIFDVEGRRAVAIVVGILLAGDLHDRCSQRRRLHRAEDVIAHALPRQALVVGVEPGSQ